MKFPNIQQRISNSSLFKDSFWAVFGNGFGSALLLLAGILIARFLGKDLYGEYGVVKSTMFYIASFATFGLGFTSTKYIAQYYQGDRKFIKSIVRDATLITFLFSSFISLILIFFSGTLAKYLDEPNLKTPFQILAIIIVFRAITTTQIGLLAGFKCFKITARNSVLSGVFMLSLCIPLTYLWGLKGSLCTLMTSQIFNAVLNYFSTHNITKTCGPQINKSFLREMISFSFPVALQESSFTICHWTGIMLLTKYSSAGELGLYTAASQWNGMITMIPGFLTSVVLSYLSSSISNKKEHNNIVKIMILSNTLCTVIPFFAVYILAAFIGSFYGESFSELPSVLRVLTFATIFEASSSVFKSEFMALGKTWTLFTLRAVRDISLVIGVFLILEFNKGVNGAICYSIITVLISCLFFTLCLVTYLILIKKRNHVTETK